jgi:hypothetical protein
LITKKIMMFHHLTVAALLVNSAMLVGVSAKMNAPLSDKDMLLQMQERTLQMQERIEYLENAVGVIADSTVPAADGGSVPLGASNRHKTRGASGSKQGRAAGSRRAKSKKKGSDHESSTICYSDGNQLDAGDTDVFFFMGDERSATLQLGVISIRNGESIKIEVSATTLLVLAKGGLVNSTGTQVYGVTGGVLMSPIIHKCDGLKNSCDDDTCLNTSCRDDGSTIDATHIKPASTLPLDVTVFEGYTNYRGGESGGGSRRRSLQEEYDLWYEIKGQADYSTTTGKFFIPSHELGEGDYLIDFKFIAGTFGYNLDIEPEASGDFGPVAWTMAEAELGPHLVEVTRMKSRHEECNHFGEEDASGDFSFDGGPIIGIGGP